MKRSARSPVSRLVRVVAAGTFDGLHDGHRYYLHFAKRLGDHLTVIVARDHTVPLIKGKQTRLRERQRFAAVAALPWVNRVILGGRVRKGHPKDRFRMLLRLKPDVICLGYDQDWLKKDIEEKVNRGLLPKVKLIQKTAHRPEELHSSLL